MSNTTSTTTRSPSPDAVRSCLAHFHNVKYTFNSLRSTVFNTLKMSAVLIPLFYRADGELMVLLTRRALTMRSHPGHIAFPGGSWDSTDPDEEHTCLREAEEEVSLPPSKVNIICRLLPRIASSGYMVMPLVGFIPDDFKPKANPAEVDSVFSLPLRRFLTKERHHHTPYNIHGMKGIIHHFQDTVNGVDYSTFGLTCAMCIELAVAVYGVAPEYMFLEDRVIDPRKPYAYQEEFLEEALVRYAKRAEEAKL